MRLLNMLHSEALTWNREKRGEEEKRKKKEK
jgi:hypothetical protein